MLAGNCRAIVGRTIGAHADNMDNSCVANADMIRFTICYSR